MTLSFVVEEEHAGLRLDVYLSTVMADCSRSAVANMIDEGLCRIGGKVASKSSYAVREGDNITLDRKDAITLEVLPQNIPLDIVYQDSYLAVINKQQGLTVHPASGIYVNTLVNALLYHIKDLSGINGVLRPGIVHRLDKDTSGLMMVAKCDSAHISLANQIQSKQCRRIYTALLEGVVKEDSGVIDKPIGRSKNDRKKMTIDYSGRSAITHYTVLERFDKYTLVKFELKTGRTHQIRVHAQYMGHPVVGDKTYGYKNQRFSLDGQLLHASEIEFLHPSNEQLMHFTVPLPDYFDKVINILRKENK